MNSSRVLLVAVAATCAAFEAQAEPLGPSALVNTNAASDSGADHSPAVAMDGLDHAIAVWTSTDSLAGTIGTDADILVARSIDRGRSWSPPIPLSADAFFDLENDRNADIATDGAGTFIVVWESGDDVLFVRSTSSGATWSAAGLLAPAGAGSKPRLATDRAGNWMVVWSGTNGGDADIFFSRSTNQGATWSAPLTLASNAATDSGDDTAPSVASNELGAWVVAWTSDDSMNGTIGTDTDILFARTLDHGSTWTTARALNTNAATDLGDDAAVDVAGDGNGRWVAAWHSYEPVPWGPDGDILVARSNGGAAWTAPAAIYTFSLIELGDEFDPRVITDHAGTWMLVWWREDSLPGSMSSDVDVLLARSTDGGTNWIGPEPINYDAITDSGDDYRPAAATSRRGDWISVWSSDDPLGGTVGTDLDIFVALTICGDGVTQANEACDDGNILDGDCCSSSCQLAASGSVCRASAGTCDEPETCNGVSAFCPADMRAQIGTICRGSAGACDLPEVCNGADAACPADVVSASGIVCRAASGTCDVAETCDGMSPTCAPNALVSAGTMCRAANGACDVADVCTGSSASCPNLYQASGVECRGAAGVCDRAEACTGVGPACPTDGFLAGVECRAAAGACDRAESCSGLSSACPADAAAFPGTSCRPAAQACDQAEVCDGVAFSCPADLLAADGSPCLDGNVCNGSERCASGACVGGPALACDDQDECTADGCFEPGGCGGAPIDGCCTMDPDCDDGNACTDDSCDGACTNAPRAGCCNNDGDCDDGDACTVEVCSGPGGTCSSSPISNCCASDADCNDSSSCTADSCDLSTNRCDFAPIAGCCAVDEDCADSNACTTESCDTNTGTCVQNTIEGCCATNADCDDGVVCTLDVCSGGTCTSTVIADCCAGDSDCGGEGACGTASCEGTTNRCEPTAPVGCCESDADCAGGSGCAATVCDVTSNACVPAAVAGCCSADSECDDGDPCTFDSCDETACSHQEIDDCVIVVPDAGAPDGAAPDGGATADGGSASDAGVDAGAQVPDTGTTTPTRPGWALDDDSCECTSHRRTGGASLWFLLAVLFALRVRRNRT